MYCKLNQHLQHLNSGSTLALQLSSRLGVFHCDITGSGTQHSSTAVHSVQKITFRLALYSHSHLGVSFQTTVRTSHLGHVYHSRLPSIIKEAWCWRPKLQCMGTVRSLSSHLQKWSHQLPFHVLCLRKSS